MKKRVLIMDCIFVEENQFVKKGNVIGSVILQKDLTFEGILEKTDTKGENLVSGTILDLQGAHFMLFSNNSIVQMKFSGVSTEENVIVGTWTAIDSFAEYEAGRGMIIFTEPENKVTFKSITQKIKNFKRGMSNFTSDLYKSFVKYMKVTGGEIISLIEKDKDEIEMKICRLLQKLKI